MKGQQGEALNNDDVDMKMILKIMMRGLLIKEENQAKVYPEVNSPVTQSSTQMLGLKAA